METNDLIRTEALNTKRLISDQKLRLAWEKFDNGDSLSNPELDALIESITSGIAFLEARGEKGGVLYRARINREDLLSFKRARAMKSYNL